MVLLSPARFKVVDCGRRWGKTALGLQATSRGHGPTRGYRKGAIDGGNIWWVAPTHGVAAQIWRDIKKAFSQAWVDKSEVEKRIELPGGGALTVKSADNPDGLRGSGLDGVVCDEFAFMDEAVWKECLRPALSDKQGWAIFISTPDGHNHFHDMFCRAVADQSGNWQAWQRPSSDNPLLTADELQAACDEIGQRAFDQEYGAKFTAEDGAEFPSEYFDGVGFDQWPERLIAKAIAVDPSTGRSSAGKGDFSAIIMAGLDKDGVVWVDADLDRRPIVTLVDDILERHQQFKPHEVACEDNGFQQAVGIILRQKCAALNTFPRWRDVTHGSELSKEQRIRRLAPYLHRKLIRFKRFSPGVVRLLSQLRSFPVGDHDDGPDALELAIQELGWILEDGTHENMEAEVIRT